MKCIAAVVMMALAFAATEASWAPLAYSAYSVNPLAYSVPHATYVQQNLGTPLAYSAYAPALSYAAQTAVYPTAYAYQPTVAVVAQKEARYLAANRGAVHDAPLPGHAVSQQSLNLEPAAGTL
ncbi:AAEL002241-PA [Aedes aegypti]|uniref:AAEL002241-PA n=2 Tax=Aedes aegypti TaxID=7159 RepID=A0A1S4F139_AEDAE|nr:adult cuticle protein 1 [Aedes aegypti]EAT46613.1 AAEL002241-PA [Aedes aegypti]